MDTKKGKTTKKARTADVRSILIAAVGGQGVLRASDILCQVMMEAGYDVKKSEVHGMAQRGGSVTSHVRYGRHVYSPIEKKGNVDILVAFENLETLRYLDYLKPDGKIIINDMKFYPPAVNLGEMIYPDNVIELAKQSFKNVKVVKAHEIAKKAGNPKTENTALLGVLSQWLDLDVNLWEKVLNDAFPKKVTEANLKAFHLGRDAK
ncbi:MAG: indolepyruvate oxidoreductase subunit beta [Syntrophales bacterium]|nr:indolepyruvate oxidoreductase subunit beta [Syntrophales bacterium]